MKKSVIIAAATAFAAAGAFVSLANAQTPASPTFGDNSLACKGINACKGQSACKSASNACKGQGWLPSTSRLDCQGQGGSPTNF